MPRVNLRRIAIQSDVWIVVQVVERNIRELRGAEPNGIFRWTQVVHGTVRIVVDAVLQPIALARLVDDQVVNVVQCAKGAIGPDGTRLVAPISEKPIDVEQLPAIHLE